jgi:uncharacterized protein
MKKTLCAIALLLPCAAWAAPAPQPDQVKVEQQLKQYYFDAARRGDIAMLKEFSKAGYDLNTRDEKGYTGLILAAYHGRAEAVDALLAAGADACAGDKRGNTALMGAIFKGELRIARRLAGAACQPNQRNNAGQTAAMYAALFQRSEILQALVERGADLAAKDHAGNTANALAKGQFQTQSQALAKP